MIKENLLMVGGGTRMMRRVLMASLIATVGSAVLGLASKEGRSQGYPAHIDQIHDRGVTIVQEGTGNSLTVEQGTTVPLSGFGLTLHTLLSAWHRGASETSLYSATIFQNGSDNQASMRQSNSSHQGTIDQNGTSNSAQVGQWGTSQKADVHQNGENLAVQADQFGHNRSFAINQFGLGTGLPVTVRQY